MPWVALMGSLEHRQAARSCGCTRLRAHASQTSTKRAGDSAQAHRACVFLRLVSLSTPNYFRPPIIEGIAYDFLFPFVQIDSLTCKAQKEFQVFARILKRNFKD